jgi:hypothetical protein
MNAAKLILALTMLAAAWPSLLLAADSPPELSHNPFSRPSSKILREEVVAVENDDGSTDPLPLQATMIGRVNRLANVGGRILKRGDEYRGYRLVRIHEQYVEFERNGQITSVYVRPLSAEDDE